MPTLTDTWTMRTAALAFVTECEGENPLERVEEFAESIPEEHLRDVILDFAAPLAIREAMKRAGNPTMAPRVEGENKWDRTARILLNQYLPLDADGTVYKRQGDFTASDCDKRAAMLKKHAKDTLEKAKQFERLGKAVRDNGKLKVEQLDVRTIVEIFNV